ncbi:MAG: hypothetical protein WDZ84_01460 [Rhodovibrionaceae bacterium]
MKFVKLTTDDNVELNGFHYSANNPRKVVVHIHGSCGNFYENPFIHVLGKKLLESNVDLVTMNLRTSGCIVEAYGDDWMGYLGGSLAEFMSCIEDISTIVRYAQGYSEHVVLQGHSLGCDRVLAYCIERGFSGQIILLSPCDSYQLHVNRISPEDFDSFLCRLRNFIPAHKFDLCPPEFYGIETEDVSYDIPISKNALLSIVEGYPYKLFRVSDSKNFNVDCDCLALIGENDDLQTCPPHILFNLINERCSRFVGEVLRGADHDFFGAEAPLSDRIVKFVCL